MPISKSNMYSFFFENPKEEKIERELNNTSIEYFNFKEDLFIKTSPDEILNGCLLSGKTTLIHRKKSYTFNQFDFFFLPPQSEVVLQIYPKINEKGKICIFKYNIEQSINLKFDIQHFNLEKFIPRGELGSSEIMTTYRTVWTAFKNGFFMSGFTNIPNDSLKRGVITSVNLEKSQEGNVEIYSHIHPENPEVYIMCIADEKYAITQYLINEEGDSVCKDLSNGEGLFFPGSLGHSNFARPTYKNLAYAMYMWIIPTFGKLSTVNPITLKIK